MLMPKSITLKSNNNICMQNNTYAKIPLQYKKQVSKYKINT